MWNLFLCLDFEIPQNISITIQENLLFCSNIFNWGKSIYAYVKSEPVTFIKM